MGSNVQVSYLMRPHMDKEIENISKSGQIKPCRYYLWNNAVFMVNKSNGIFRFIVDTRSLLDFSSSFNLVGLKDESLV